MNDLLDQSNITTDDTLRTELLAKWKDKPTEELLNAKVESDLYIKTLEKRSDELRNDFVRASEQAKAQASLQDLIDQLNEKQNTNSSSTTPANEKIQPSYDPKEIQSLISQTLEQSKMQEKKTSNFNMVQNKLKEKYGDNYATQLSSQMDTLGITKDDLNEMASTRPQVLIKALGLDEPVQKEVPFMSPPRSGMRSDNFAPRTQKRTWSYYQEMKKTDPARYRDPKTTIQMHKDSAELGAAFDDGNSSYLDAL